MAENGDWCRRLCPYVSMNNNVLCTNPRYIFLRLSHSPLWKYIAMINYEKLFMSTHGSAYFIDIPGRYINPSNIPVSVYIRNWIKAYKPSLRHDSHFIVCQTCHMQVLFFQDKCQGDWGTPTKYVCSSHMIYVSLCSMPGDYHHVDPFYK